MAFLYSIKYAVCSQVWAQQNSKRFHTIPEELHGNILNPEFGNASVQFQLKQLETPCENCVEAFPTEFQKNISKCTFGIVSQQFRRKRFLTQHLKQVLRNSARNVSYQIIPPPPPFIFVAKSRVIETQVRARRASTATVDPKLFAQCIFSDFSKNLTILRKFEYFSNFFRFFKNFQIFRKFEGYFWKFSFFCNFLDFFKILRFFEKLIKSSQILRFFEKLIKSSQILSFFK